MAVLVLSFLFFPILLPACTVSCKNNLSISLGSSGEALITPLILLQDPSCDPSEFTVDIKDPNGISIGNTLTCEYVGLIMTATVIQISNGNNCSTLLTVSDYINPQIVCSDTIVLCNQSVDPSVTGYPLATDNCSMFTNTDLNYVDEFMDLACFAVYGTDTITSQIQRTWSVQDESGNVNSCIQMIYLKRVTIADVTFPAHRDDFDAPALTCGQDPTDLLLTGEPSVNGTPIDNGGVCELIVSHTDQIVPLCGAVSHRVLRTWTIIDYCSGDFTLNVQIINVLDNTAPVIICPGDITIGTLQNDCSAIVNFPVTSATDDCSTIIITPSWAYGSGYGPFLNIPIGTYPVTYSAQDACGNVSTCIMNITVMDEIPPTPVCDFNTAINLTIFGNATVSAITFDDGSYDNCGIDSFAVSRDGINFGAFATFDCSDIEYSPIEVTLRVWDLAGNYNDCTINTIIDDKLNPAISCPSDIYISCSEDYNDLNIVGLPIIDDNCTIDTFYYSDVLNLNACNEGTITRTWTVIDAGSNSNTCTQIITLEDNTPLSIIWPPDFVTSICGDSTGVSFTGEPVLINDDCESISIIHEDETIFYSPSCYRILRTWSIYEWCTFDPNSGTNEGFWTDIQIIDVVDNTAPLLTCPPDTLIGMFANDCSGILISLAPPTALDCNPTIQFTNDSPYATSNGAEADGFYPPGIHIINYTATDGCGNLSTCSRVVTILDAKAPTPNCYGGINLNIGMDGTVIITPNMINNGSYDNCTSTENLIMTVSPDLFTCDDLGPQTVMLTVVDEAGNSAVCTSIVTIQNNNNICETPAAIIAGVIISENGSPVELVEIVLSGNEEDTIMNDNTGYFEFLEVPLSGNYEITPTKDIYYTNGVSTFDLVYIQRHILGIQTLTSPYKMIAADINNSGGVSTIDLVKLRRLILQMDDEFSNNTSWRFVQESFVFPNPDNPFASTFPESLVVNQLEEDILSADFIAIKIGDVNGNANPSAFGEGGEGDNRGTSKVLKLNTPTASFEKGKTIEIPVFADDFDEILGCQLTFDFDEKLLGFIDVKQGCLKNLGEDNFNFSKSGQGLITMSWVRTSAEILTTDEALFVLEFQCFGNGNVENHFNINSKLLNAEAYSEGMEILGINFEFSRVQKTEREQFMLYQNYPNPFGEITVVPFFLPDVEQVRFEVFDTKGHIVQRFEKRYEAGYQKISLNRNEFEASGIYFFRMTLSNGDQQTKSLIVK